MTGCLQEKKDYRLFAFILLFLLFSLALQATKVKSLFDLSFDIVEKNIVENINSYNLQDIQVLDSELSKIGKNKQLAQKMLHKKNKQGHSVCSVLLKDVLMPYQDFKKTYKVVQFHPNNPELVAFSIDKNTYIRNIRNRKCIQMCSGHDAKIISTQFNADGSRILTTSRDKTIRFWDTKTGDCVRIINIIGPVIPKYLSENSKYIAAIKNGSVIIFDTKTAKEKVLFKSRKNIKNIIFSPDGSKAAVRFYDVKFECIFDVKTGKCLHTLDNGVVVCFSPDSKVILGATRYGNLRCIWRVGDGEIVWKKGYENRKNIKGGIRYFSPSLFSQDSKRMLTIHEEKVFVWDINTKNLTLTLTGHKKCVNISLFSPDDSFILTQSYNGETIRIWHAQHGDCLYIIKSCSYYTGFSPDGSYITGICVAKSSLTKNRYRYTCMWKCAELCNLSKKLDTLSLTQAAVLYKLYTKTGVLKQNDDTTLNSFFKKIKSIIISVLDENEKKVLATLPKPLLSIIKRYFII